MSAAAPVARAKSRRAVPYRLTAPAASEHQEQRAIAATLRLELCREGHVSLHGVVWFSIDQANFAGVPGTRIARGICAGVPDVIVMYRGRCFWIELKAAAGHLSGPQREMAVALMGAQCAVGVARDPADVLRLLDAWEIPRAMRVRL